jgi:hypothetical protein
MQRPQLDCLAGGSAGLLFCEWHVVKWANLYPQWHDLRIALFTVLYSNIENLVLRTEILY